MPRIEFRKPNSMIARRWSPAILAGLALIASAQPAARAETASHPLPEVSLSAGFRFSESSGEELFASVCQGCHMPDGRGATGAGNYPSLAGDNNLVARGYPVYVVVRGQKAMQQIGSLMSDEQVVAVVNYVRTHFGNRYPDAVTIEDVRQARP